MVITKNQKFIKKGDRLDRYRRHLIDGSVLPEKYAEYFEKLELANSLLCQGYSEGNVADILKNTKKYTDVRQAYGIIRDAKDIWGDVKKSSRAGLRHVMYENFMRLARICEKNGDLEGAGKNFERAARLYDLFNPDESPIDASVFLVPVPVTFTTNPSVLKEPEDAEYEILE